MASRLALLCPGQGAQHRAMFDLARTDPAASAFLDALIPHAGLDQPLDVVLADDVLLFSNRYAQPLMVAATLANWKALARDLPEPGLVAGYSIGEVSAYAVAGALNPLDTVALARTRALLMNACRLQTQQQALIAVSGLPIGAIEALLREHDFHIAIVNGEDSVIVGGRAELAPSLTQALAALGARAATLPVELASHTPLIAGAVAPLAAELARRPFRDPQVPVLSGISAERILKSGMAIEHLSRQVAEPVLWKNCMDALPEAGITVALELGPGSSLSRMLQARHPQIATRSVADFRSLDGVAAWLARHVE
jgi:[acyl-carrier-protein] S-malonyltransferase